MKTPLLLLLVLVALAVPPGSRAEEEEAAWFTNVSKESGLAGVRAKDCIFTDLNGDGYFDLCLDRQRLYLSKEGDTFTSHEDHAIDFPTVSTPPTLSMECMSMLLSRASSPRSTSRMTSGLVCRIGL